MFWSFKEIENQRVILATGESCGRIKDVYFDDASWQIKFVKISLISSSLSPRQVLLRPGQISCLSDDGCAVNLTKTQLLDAPLDSSYLPVCQQYAVFAYGSPGSLTIRRKVADSDPHLRSARAVQQYSVYFGGEYIGKVNDLVFENIAKLRYIRLEEVRSQRRIHFHILPATVSGITWSMQRILLRELKPVTIETAPRANPAPAFAAA